MTGDCETVLEDASRVAWFGEVGQPLPDATGQRLENWEQWPGPESPRVEQLALDLQKLKEDLEHEDPSSMVDWDTCVAKLVEKIAASVPDWSADEDAWHATSAAVWHAAWVSALHSKLVRSRRPIPTVLADQLAWFTRGRWPAAYSSESGDASRKVYMIF